MKDIINKINEGKYCRLFSEVQNEVGKDGEYHTYSFQDGQKKFKKGFIYVNASDDFFGIQALNSAKEYEEFVGVEEGSYSELDNLKIGETTEIDNSKIIRIW
jgi:hypothetical protein